jgi:hypothetical protein
MNVIKQLLNWLGRLDSNQGMAESKSAALPLGYAPTGRLLTARTARTILMETLPINVLALAFSTALARN